MINKSIIVILNIFCLPVAYRGLLFSNIPEPKAVLEPVDTVVFIGESLKLQCHLTDRTLQMAPHGMYFEISAHYKNLSWIIPQDNVTMVNNKTIFAYVNITEDYSNITTIACMYMNATSRIQLISQFIQVEKPIREITNFTGVYNYNRYMELSWSLGETYLSDTNINVTVDWSANAPPNKQGTGCITQTKESCTIVPSGQDIIFMRIIVAYSSYYERPSVDLLDPLYNTSATSVIKIVVNDYLKTQPPQNLRVVDRNSTCAKLTWDRPLYFRSCNCQPFYELTAMEKDEISSVVTSHGDNPFPQDSITVCSLHPFTTYKLSVKLKAKEINPWSEPAFTEVTTNEDCPLTGPPLTGTSYHADDCVENKTDVTVYWNDPLKSSLQGELTRFVVVIHNVTVLLRKGFNYYKISLDCGIEHHVLVYSATAAGNSLVPSAITIPRNSAELPEVNDVTVRMEKPHESSDTDNLMNVTVAWDPGSLIERNATLVLYMCQYGNVPYTCFNDFSTREISVDKTEMLLKDLDISVSLFGYALKDYQGRKRGIQWINCVYRADQIPVRPAPVNINVGNKANTLMISWTTARCDRETKVLILQYHLFVCTRMVSQPRDSKSCSNTTVSSRKSSYIAEDLKGGSTYYVYIQAESEAGLGLASKPVPGVPGVGNSISGNVIDIVMGTLSAMILASLLIFCFVRQCKQSRKQIMSLASYNFKLWENIEKLQHQVSKKSDSDTASKMTSSLKVSLVPPALPFRSDIDVSHRVFSQTTHPAGSSSEMACDAKPDISKDKIPVIATHIRPAETQLSDSELPDLNGREHEYSNSGSANPYVKMTNECFPLVSDSPTVSVDEGYNSPEVEIDSPAFSLDASLALLARLSPTPPVCKNGFIQPDLPFMSQQCQDVFRSLDLSPISSQSQKILPGSDVSFVSPPQSDVISETNVSMNSPQSLQSLIREISMTPRPKVAMDSSVIHVYNVTNATSLPIQALPPPAVNSLGRNSSAISSLDSSPSAVNFLCSKNSKEPNVYFNSGSNLLEKSQIELHNSKKLASADSTQVCDNTESRSDLCRANNSYQHVPSGYVTCGIDGVMMNSELVDSEHESVDSENRSSSYKPNCQTTQNLATLEGSQSPSAGYRSLEFLENSPELDVNSQDRFGTHKEDYVDQTQKIDFVCQGGLKDFTNNNNSAETDDLDSYVICAVNDRMNSQDSKLERGSVASQNRCMNRCTNRCTNTAFACTLHKPNWQANISTQNACLGYKSDNHMSQCSNCDETGETFEFVTNQGGSQNTSGGYRSLSFLENSHQFNFGKQAFGIQKEDCIQQAGFRIHEEDCIQQVGLEINEEDFIQQDEVGIHKEDCTQQTGLGIHEEDCIQQAGLEIHEEDFIQQAELGLNKENFGTQGEFKMHNENIANDIDDDDNDVADEIDSRNFDYVRQIVTDKELNIGIEGWKLKPLCVENNTLKQFEVFSEQPTSENSPYERNDLENTSADDFATSEGDYVSQVQLLTQARPDISHFDAILHAGSRRWTQECSQISEDPDLEFDNPEGDFGYVSVNCLPGGNMSCYEPDE